MLPGFVRTGVVMNIEKKNHLVDAVLQAVEDDKGTLRLSCGQAFELAKNFGVTPETIGAICNQHNVRIRSCQLGCFG